MNELTKKTRRNNLLNSSPRLGRARERDWSSEVVLISAIAMGSNDEAVQISIHALERHLLAASASKFEEEEEEGETVLYTASFEEMEERFVQYQTARWVLYSLLLILAWGIGLLMLLYLPLRIHICRKEFRSKKLYLTPDAIVYKV